MSLHSDLNGHTLSMLSIQILFDSNTAGRREFEGKPEALIWFPAHSLATVTNLLTLACRLITISA